MNTSTEIDHDALAASLPLSELNVANPSLFQDDVWMPYFSRLRREDPVHFCPESRFGPYWSVTKYKDIMEVGTNHKIYSSDIEWGGIHVGDKAKEFRRRSMITSDPPLHDEQRKVIQPIVSPGNLANAAVLIRERTCRVLDDLPRNETFNWVDRVSINLTTQMLATLFDFPFEERRKLTHWSDVSFVDLASGGPINTEEKRLAELQPCLDYFTRLWEERADAPPGSDLISLFAHGDATKNFTPHEFLGNLMTFIVGGNETTRNSMSGSVLFLNQNPAEDRKLRDNPSLIDSMISEVIRYQTPIIAFRRTAVEDADLNGKVIKKGDKVVMWYISGNRDADVIDRPDDFIIDRSRPRQHIAFGFGIHRCVGNRLAELQLKILWEEILNRSMKIEVVGAPKRIFSLFVRGISELPVRISS